MNYTDRYRALRTVGAAQQSQQHTTTSPKGASMTSTIRLNEFSIYHENGDAFIYSTDSDELNGVAARKNGSDQAAVLVRLDVDGDHTAVIADLHQSSDVRVLSRAVEALSEVLRHVVSMLPEGSAGGRCMSVGEWGRCKLSDGHDAAHAFPTQVEWTAERVALGKPA